MHYRTVVIGTKDTTRTIAEYINDCIRKVDLIVSVSDTARSQNHIAGFCELENYAQEHGIAYFGADDYSLQNNQAIDFFLSNSFGIGICMGWQRLIPKQILDCFNHGVFGFHGSCAYLPYGRGRSPLNWALVNGDNRVIMNLFRYDENPDSPNVFERTMFDVNDFDTIRTLQYKNIICAKRMIKDLLIAEEKNCISLEKSTHDFDLWYPRRTPADGKIDFKMKTKEILNLIRAVTHPFPGAFATLGGKEITVWEAAPFDRILDFSDYCPGEIIEVFDGKLIVRTIDGSIIINDWEYSGQISSESVMD